MTDTRHQVADVLFTAAILGVGLLSGNPILASVVAGIGVNLASDLTRAGWGQVCHRLLGESGLRNHDLQQAMLRAFRQAITHLEQAWWQTSRGRQMRRGEPDTMRITSEAFKQLGEDACVFCAPDHLGRVAGNDQVRVLLYGDAASARAACSVQLADYLHGHDTQLVAFIEKHLVGELAFWFGEELKADRPESNRAWRAFQRLLLAPIGDQDAHRLAAIWMARAARSTLPVNRERGLRIVSMASRHADMVAEPTERMRLRRDILKSMLAAGDTTLWEEAVVQSLDFEETTFRTFDWFGQSALKLQQEDKTFPPRLLDVIDWAEQLMRV